MSERASGRRILVGVGVSVVLVAGIVGFVIGANGADASPSIVVFGLVALPSTPGAVAAYGMALTAAVLGALFLAVSVASRYDDGA